MQNNTGCLVIDISGTFLSPEDKEIIAHPLVSGVILFARNYESRQQLKQLCQDLHSIKDLIVMVDQEGGRVQRFLHEFTPLPAFSAIGDLYAKDPEKAYQLAHASASIMASELLQEGVDLSLAPVIDLDKNLNAVVAGRAFHHDPNVVLMLAKTYISGLKEAGMAAVLKHFPGHGGVMLDSHIAQPEDLRLLSQLESEDMVPFLSLILEEVPAIMAAHIRFPHIDALPVTYSHYWLTGLLRKRYGFKGTLLSDDLNMKGAQIFSYPEDKVRSAKEAGCDLILYCNNRGDVLRILDKLEIADFVIPKEKMASLLPQYKKVTKRTPKQSYALLKTLEQVSV